ncbi:MAG TPA: hypothetical protein VFT53_02095 [Candidatus Saccharimonadales bacterium]|nr:hypothetical protein [Candidatus Saccharimonadales bacterium]
MPPTQQTPNYGPTMPIPTGPQDTSQFDFIMGGSGQKHAPTAGFGGSSSAAKRVGLVAGGFAVLGILVWVFVSVLMKPAGIDATALLAIAQKQTELARISQTPALNAVQQPTQNFAETTYLTMLTNQATFVAYIANHGTPKPTSKTLSATKNTQTDTSLQNAQAAGTYDTTYITTAKNQLTAYSQALAQAYASSKRTSERQLLQDAYNQAQLLVTMSAQQE